MADWKLLIEDDAGQTITVPLFRDVITIGRKEGNTIRLTERNVSRFHAKIVRENGTVFVEDLQSYTGVKLNGDRIKGKIEVREGDLIEIGDYHLELQREGAELPTNPSLNEPTQRLTPSPGARMGAGGASSPQSADDADDEFAGDTQRWEPPGTMEPIGVGLPTVQDEAPVSAVDTLGEPPTVDEGFFPGSRRSDQGQSDLDETLRQEILAPPAGLPLPTVTDPFADAESVLNDATNDETLPAPGGPEDAGLLAAMTEQLPHPAALLDSDPGGGDDVPEVSPLDVTPLAPPLSPAAPPPVLTPLAPPASTAAASEAPERSAPRPTASGMPQARALAVEKDLPAIPEGPTEDTQAITRSPGPSEDVHIDKARLVALNTVFAGVVFPIVRLETVIGRVEDNDLVIEHRSVSRSHAKVIREGNRYRIVDLKSANGILVNGLEVESHVLRPGDVLELGRVKLRFVPAGERFQLSPAEIERARLADVQGADDFADETAAGVSTSTIAGAYPTPTTTGPQRSTMLIAALAAAVVILAIVVVVMLVGGKDGPVEGATAPVDGSKGSIERAALLEKAGELKAAADMLTALVADGDPAAAAQLARVEGGIANQSRAKEIQEHLDAKRYKDAVEVGGTINADAPFAEAAKAKAELARVSGADAAAKSATTALDKNDLDSAASALEELAFFEPDSERTRTLGARLKDAQASKAEPPDDEPEKADARKGGRADRPETRPGDKREARASPATKDREPPREERKQQPVADPEGAAKLIVEARASLLKNRFGDVIQTLNQALKKDPGNADAYLLLGTAYRSLGEKKKSIQNYKVDLSMRPRAHDANIVRNWVDELEGAP